MNKDYELEIDERPYRIHWHGHFLRSYDDEYIWKESIKWFESFLISITYYNIKDNNE